MPKKYNYTMKPGRPLEYTEAFIKNEALALLDYIDNHNPFPFPFLKDFCGKRGYHSQRISDFKDVPEFMEALLVYKDAVESKLVGGALTNKFNSFFAFNTLKNIAMWRDHRDPVIDQSIHTHYTKYTDEQLTDLCLKRNIKVPDAFLETKSCKQLYPEKKEKI